MDRLESPKDISGLPTDDKGAEVEIIISVLLGLATIVVGARVYTRWCLLRSGSWDDYLMILAWMFCTSHIAITYISVGKHHLGQHVYLVPEAELQNSMMNGLRNMYIQQILYTISVGLARVSGAIMLIRLSVNRTLNRVYKGYLFLSILVMTLYTFFSILRCVPPKMLWTTFPPPEGGKCVLNNKYVAYTGLGLNILLDLLFVTLPIPLVLSLSFPTRQKIALLLTFMFGSLAVVGSIMIIVKIRFSYESDDPPYEAVPAFIWLTVDMAMLIIAASLPTLKAFVLQFSCNLLGPSFGSSGRSQNFYTRNWDIDSETVQFRSLPVENSPSGCGQTTSNPSSTKQLANVNAVHIEETITISREKSTRNLRRYRDLDGKADAGSTPDLNGVERIVPETVTTVTAEGRESEDDSKGWKTPKEWKVLTEFPP